MKKFLIPCICLISVVSLAGCANSGDSQTLSSLNNQLKRVESIVSSTSVDEVYDVSPSVTLESNEPYNSIQSFRALSNANMLREEEIRQEILSISAQLKSCTDKEYKLGKKKINALKDITNNLSKYSSHLNGTKSQVKNSVNKIRKNLNKVNSINIEVATSSYITLNNSMNERYAYLCNIYDNLEQACIILECKCNSTIDNSANKGEYDFENTPYIEDENDLTENNNIDDIEENNNLNDSEKQNKSGMRFIKNIDSYNTTNETSSNNNVVNENINTEKLKDNKTDQNPPPYPPHFPIFNQPNGVNYPPNAPIPRPYPINNKYPNNFNNYYGNGYNYAGNRINPNRNTDTFYSFNRNIDTYRFNPNFYNYTY